MAAFLLALTAAAGAATGEPTDDRLSTTLLGRLEPGGEPRLAVRWDGPHGALLDAWVDLDGDGAQGPHELVVAGRPLEPGIEVVGLEVPPEAYVIPEPGLWVWWREPRPALHDANERENDAKRDGCAWQRGFYVEDLESTVEATAVFDDASGPALYAGGSFTTAGGIPSTGIGAWSCAGCPTDHPPRRPRGRVEN